MFSFDASFGSCDASAGGASGAGGGSSAGGDASSLDAGSACVPSIPGVTFSKDVVPIFASCAGELCHRWTYSKLVNMPAVECCDGRKIVSPGRPDQSYIVQKLEGSPNICGGSPMPLGGKRDAHAVAVISSWICLGALNN